jgi:hypothetical protein
MSTIHPAAAPSGIEVKATATINDWYALGKTVAEAGSDDQARFLAGMAARLNEPWGLMQMEYIADSARAQETTGRISQMVLALHYRLDPAEATP